jgi:hypothetical protein
MHQGHAGSFNEGLCFAPFISLESEHRNRLYTSESDSSYFESDDDGEDLYDRAGAAFLDGTMARIRSRGNRYQVIHDRHDSRVMGDWSENMGFDDEVHDRLLEMLGSGEFNYAGREGGPVSSDDTRDLAANFTSSCGEDLKKVRSELDFSLSVLADDGGPDEILFRTVRHSLEKGRLAEAVRYAAAMTSQELAESIAFGSVLKTDLDWYTQGNRSLGFETWRYYIVSSPVKSREARKITDELLVLEPCGSGVLRNGSRREVRVEGAVRYFVPPLPLAHAKGWKNKRLPADISVCSPEQHACLNARIETLAHFCYSPDYLDEVGAYVGSSPQVVYLNALLAFYMEYCEALGCAQEAVMYHKGTVGGIPVCSIPRDVLAAAESITKLVMLGALQLNNTFDPLAALALYAHKRVEQGRESAVIAPHPRSENQQTADQDFRSAPQPNPPVAGTPSKERASRPSTAGEPEKASVAGSRFAEQWCKLPAEEASGNGKARRSSRRRRRRSTKSERN